MFLAVVTLLFGLAPTAGAGRGMTGETDLVETRIVFTGDILVHTPLAARARTAGGYDFTTMFTRVAPILRDADIAICHLEVPLSPTSSDLSSFPNFNAPAEVASALAWAGYDGCSTASNHSFDRGVAGVAGTLDVLQQAGLLQAGMSSTPEDAWAAAVYEGRGLRLSHIAATYWLNGYRMPDEEQWYVQLLDKEEILAIAAREKRSGSDLVAVSIHCCVEYQHEPTPAQGDLYRELIGSPDIDLVVGHHSHVVGPVEEIDGEYIVYGLGNFLSAQNFRPGVADGVIVSARATQDGGAWSITGIDVVPTWVQPGTYRIFPAVAANSGSHQRTLEIVRMYGADVAQWVWPGHPGARLPRF